MSKQQENQKMNEVLVRGMGKIRILNFKFRFPNQTHPKESRFSLLSLGQLANTKQEEQLQGTYLLIHKLFIITERMVLKVHLENPDL